MAFKHNKDSGSKAASLLATCFVVLGGILACMFIVLVSSPSPKQSATICASFFAGIVFLLWLMRDRPPENATAAYYSWFRWSWRAKREDLRYEPRRRRAPAPEETEPPAPPTVESIRALRDDVKTWVPSSTRRPPRQTTEE